MVSSESDYLRWSQQRHSQFHRLFEKPVRYEVKFRMFGIASCHVSESCLVPVLEPEWGADCSSAVLWASCGPCWCWPRWKAQKARPSCRSWRYFCYPLDSLSIRSLKNSLLHFLCREGFHISNIWEQAFTIKYYDENHPSTLLLMCFFYSDHFKRLQYTIWRIISISFNELHTA